MTSQVQPWTPKFGGSSRDHRPDTGQHHWLDTDHDNHCFALRIQPPGLYLPAMAYTVYRFFRSLRSMCAPLTAVIGFSCLLTFIFILYQPTPGPGMIQRLGWQSWETVSMSQQAAVSTGHNGQSSDSSPIGGSNGVASGVDWWNVTADEPKVDGASLPLDIWAPLLPHDTGRACMYPVACWPPY